MTEPTPDRIAHLEELEAAVIAYFRTIDMFDGIDDLTNYDAQRLHRLAIDDAKLRLRSLVA